jgi:hypothetical protein
MALGKYVYTTDKGRQYLVRLDRKIAEVAALGFPLASESQIENLDFLPREMKMRNFNCTKKRGGVFAAGSELMSSSRVFAVGSKSASILANREDFRYKGSVYVPRRYHPEKGR